ncbi:MAG: type II secretion system minor pseudopilin GspK [Burkholderiaceae bacterium]|nr:type II secretion system minor pseudopilin GspK [Burkholderiaceae bacterium]
MKRQRGVAVVTALLLTTLAITIVASLFWQQQVQVRTIENQRLQQQAKWVLLGALDWARLILREDGKNSAIDHLGEPWAMPLAETRLDDYLEKNSTDTNTATLSGQIFDAQARFNLTNLASGKSINTGELMAFERLLANLNISPALAKKVAESVAATPAGGIDSSGEASSLPIGITQVDDLLMMPGFTPEMVSRLKNYVVVLPRFTPINVNTAPAEVLAARISKLSLADAAALIVSREQAYFRDHADFIQRLPRDLQTVGVSEIAVSTGYFIVHGAVKVDRATQQIDALIERNARGTQIVWIRDY